MSEMITLPFTVLYKYMFDHHNGNGVQYDSVLIEDKLAHIIDKLESASDFVHLEHTDEGIRLWRIASWKASVELRLKQKRESSKRVILHNARKEAAYKITKRLMKMTGLGEDYAGAVATRMVHLNDKKKMRTLGIDITQEPFTLLGESVT